MSTRAVHLLERKGLWLRHQWPIVLSGAAEPLLYLAAAAVGIGQLVGNVHIDGHEIAYLDFVGPGLLAATAMTGAVFDTTIDVLWRLRFSRSYDAILGTPMSPRDVALGEVGAGTLRGTFNAVLFLIILTAVGAVHSAWSLLTVVAAALTALAFAAMGIAFTTFLRSFSAFEWLPTITTTLFLFSTTFFPASAYGSAQDLVQLSPLYHAVCLERASMTGTFQLADAGHALVLVTITVAGLAVASRRLGTLFLR